VTVAVDARPIAARLLDAAHDCVARVGLTKTTVDDVAREAGYARATLYRHFAGKRPLLEALREREIDRLDAELGAAVDGASDLVEACTALLVAGAEAILDHAALATILAVEPTVLLPALSFDGCGTLHDRARRLVAPHLAPFTDRPAAAERLAELLVRVALSHLSSPTPGAPITDPDVARRLVERYLVPGFVTEPALERFPA
jgi:AcrR family transcriptional regulator